MFQRCPFHHSSQCKSPTTMIQELLDHEGQELSPSTRRNLMHFASSAVRVNLITLPQNYHQQFVDVLGVQPTTESLFCDDNLPHLGLCRTILNIVDRVRAHIFTGRPLQPHGALQIQLPSTDECDFYYDCV